MFLDWWRSFRLGMLPLAWMDDSESFEKSHAPALLGHAPETPLLAIGRCNCHQTRSEEAFSRQPTGTNKPFSSLPSAVDLFDAAMHWW